MRILVIGIDGAEGSSIFGDERLSNLRRLMEYGCFGLLTNGHQGGEADAWASLLTSRSGGSLRVEASSVQEILQGSDAKSVWRQVEEQGGKAIVFWAAQYAGREIQTEIFSACLAAFEMARAKLHAEEWDYFQMIDAGLLQLRAGVAAGSIGEQVSQDYYHFLDEQIGMIFELLTDETLVLVVSPYGVNGQGWFILASSNNPLSGEVSEVSLLEIAPTLLELGGYPIPETMQGVSLVAGKALDLLASGTLSGEEEQLLRERLSGLGYIA